MTHRHIALAPHVALGVLAALLTACGGGTDPGGGGGPYACMDVWRSGLTLPSDYDGSCTEDDGSTSVSGLVDCTDGSTYATYDDRFFAAPGDTVQAGPKGDGGTADPALQKAYDDFARDCLG